MLLFGRFCGQLGDALAQRGKLVLHLGLVLACGGLTGRESLHHLATSS